MKEVLPRYMPKSTSDASSNEDDNPQSALTSYKVSKKYIK
jgi:hypothetical protein